MKSGRKIHAAILQGGNPAARISALKNGSLRSLITHLGKFPLQADDEVLFGRAIAEAARRFLAKGKEIL